MTDGGLLDIILPGEADTVAMLCPCLVTTVVMREWLECWLYGETLSLVGMKVAELVVVGRLLDALLVEATLVLSMVDRWLCLVLFTLVELENGVGCSGQLEPNLLVETEMFWLAEASDMV